MIHIETLLYVVKNGRVLLIRKKRGLGVGFFNGVGGKAKPGETPEQAAVREMAEEVGAEPLEMEWRGLLEFWNFEDGVVESIHYVHVFVAQGHTGELRESDEAAPVWGSLMSMDLRGKRVLAIVGSAVPHIGKARHFGSI